MALSKNITLPILVTKEVAGEGVISTSTENQYFKEAYVKVAVVSGDKATATASVIFTLNGEEAMQRSYDFAIDLDGPNFIKQAYEHLKTLPEFEDAIDC